MNVAPIAAASAIVPISWASIAKVCSFPMILWMSSGFWDAFRCARDTAALAISWAMIRMEKMLI